MDGPQHVDSSSIDVCQKSYQVLYVLCIWSTYYIIQINPQTTSFQVVFCWSCGRSFLLCVVDLRITSDEKRGSHYHTALWKVQSSPVQSCPVLSCPIQERSGTGAACMHEFPPSRSPPSLKLASLLQTCCRSHWLLRAVRCDLSSPFILALLLY